MADTVQPGLVVEIHGVSYQRVSLPMPDRVAHPQRAESRIVRAAIRKNLMADGVVFEEQDDFAGRLNHLHRKWMKKNPRVAGRGAGVVNGVVRFRDGIRT